MAAKETAAKKKSTKSGTGSRNATIRAPKASSGNKSTGSTAKRSSKARK